MHPADMISFWAKAAPERLAIVELDMAVTYRGLADAIEAVSAHIDRYQFDRREPIAIAINDPARALPVYFALLRRGIVPFPTGRQEVSYLAAAGVRTLIHAEADQILPGGRNIRFDDSWLGGEQRSSTVRSSPSEAAQTDIIFFTSATTGTPKKTILPPGAFEERVKLLPITGEASFSRVLVVPGVGNSFGFMRVAMLLYAGKTACFARDVNEQLLLIGTYKIESMTGSPQQYAGLIRFIRNDAKTKFQLGSLKEVRIGAGFSTPELVERVQMQFCQNVVIEYGATEAGVLAISNYRIITKVPNAVGIPLPGVSIEVVDEADTPLPEGEEGKIRLRSRYAAEVFAANNPERAREAVDLWWYPGDLGWLTSEGVLCISGRANDVINSGGVKVSAVIIEEAIRNHPGVRDAGVCNMRGTSGIEEVWIAIVPDAAFNLLDLMRSLDERHAFKATLGQVVMVEKIPRGNLGKLQRNKLREMLQQRTDAPAERRVAQ